ncbi:discoidin, CUB and LCCL domain-containing protein 2-like [Sinocyclocheilus anshuiensis]|uniref:discoidin, CUB and LCCL domain-containing protein 2-like n=1 Tax=Sinocyclocheilus anshuiensis TaxID=1608454 RepID=UPI0007B85670|nr:PREDICTED: discoidin, CUB and LCCL domain-containing protein 2-like [Sinocyclocheilus anshuiensis]
MDVSLMVGRGTGGAAVSILILFILLLGARSSRAQKGDGCGHTVLDVGSGSLASLGYPLSYPTNCVCEWEISVTTGHTILVRIADLDIDTNNCQVSYLRLYNGHGPGRTEIVKFCGGREWRDAVIHSEGHQVTVQFMSGPHYYFRSMFLTVSKKMCLFSHPSDLITCLEKGKHFSEAEFSKFCPAGCLTDFGEVSGTIPHGYRDSSPLCLAGIHAGVVSNTLGGQISVVSSKGIPHYESSLANNVTSVPGNLSPSLFTFKTSGCYGTLGLESGVVSHSQITASSEWEWGGHGKEPTVWGPTGARLKTPGRPWAAANSDTKEWIQVDLKKEKKITGITTTGSSLQEYQFYISAYEVLYSHDGQQWKPYQEVGSDKNKIFQGNTNYLQEVRNNFIPPIEARFIRICPLQWHQRIALKMELLGCQPHAARPRIFHPAPPPPRRKSTVPPLQERTTHTPNIRNTAMPPHSHDEVALVAVLVPVLVVVLTTLVLVMVCSWLWKNRKSPEVTYDLPQWERTVWWKSMKQLLPSKLDGDDCVRYSSSARVDHQRPRVEHAEYTQPLVTGTMASLGQRSTFKPEEAGGPEYDAPIPVEHYHAYAEPLPASGTEYATPIMIDRANHLSGGTLPFRGHSLVARTDSSQSASSAYDTPKSTSDQATPTEGQLYQVPQNTHSAQCQNKD